MNDSPFAPGRGGNRDNNEPRDDVRNEAARGDARNGTSDIVRAAPMSPSPYGSYGAFAPVPPPYGMSPGTYGPGGEVPDAGNGVQAFRLFGQMLRRRSKIIGVTLLSVLAATYLISKRNPDTFQSTATLQVVTSARGSGTNDDNDPLAGVTGQAQSRKIDTQLAILNSPQILAASSKRLPRSYQAAVRGISITAREDAGDLINVAVSATTPQAAQRMANAIVNTYVNSTLNSNRQLFGGGAAYAQAQLKTVLARQAIARRKLLNFQKGSGFVDAESQTGALLTQLNDLQTQLRGVTRDRAAAQAQLGDARAQAASIPRETYKVPSIVPRPEVEAQKAALNELQIKLVETSQEYQPSSPQVQSLQAQIRQLQLKIAGEAPEQPGGRVLVPNPIRAALDQKISELESSIQGFDASLNQLRGQAGRAQEQFKQVPQLGQQLAQLKSEVAADDLNAQRLQDIFSKNRASQEARLPDARVLFSGALPAALVGQNRKRNLVFGAALGLLLALALAALVDWMDDRVHSEDDAKSALQLPVLAQVPMAHGSPALTSGSNGALPSPMLENFRMLRTLVAFSPLEQQARVVLMTSSLPGEGKSVCAANLAIAAALSGESVILIDGDLRRPTQHELFKIPNDVGFSSVAGGHCSLRDALKETRTPNLRLLTGGPDEPNPFMLLSGARGRAVLREAAELADLVVLDSPPALLFADAQILACEADAVLLVVSSRDAGKREIARTRALLAQTGARPVGIVLNKLGGEADSYDKYAAKYYGRYNRPGSNGSSNGAANGANRNGTGRITPVKPAASTTVFDNNFASRDEDR